MKFIRPCAEYLDSYIKAKNEDIIFRSDNIDVFKYEEDVIEKSYKREMGIDLPPGWVRATTFWAVDGGKFIGEVSIRHELTPALLNFGGNIGYEVRHSCSGMGYGTKILSMAKKYCKEELNLSRVLVTCDDDNTASQKIIEKNGGVLENKVRNDFGTRVVTTRRYWIDLYE